MNEWLDVIPWILGASAVSLGLLLFQSPAPPIPVRAEVNARGAEVIDLAEFRQRRAQSQSSSGQR